MTYDLRTPTIGFDEHEMRSLRRWLNQFATVNGKDIWLQRPPEDFTRPAYVIKEIDRQPVDRGRSMTMEQTDWQIEVLTEDFWTAKREVAEIRQRFLQSERIPLYLWSWKFPDIYVEELSGQGSLPAGEVSVGISAVNHEDEESLMSNTVQITVAMNSAIRISWTPYPRGASVAKEYRMYAGADGAETLEATVADPLGSHRHSVVHDLPSLSGGGGTPPTSSVFFANRYIRIITDQLSSRVMEHPAADDIFNGIIMFKTQVESVRIAKPGATILEPAIETVGIDLEVN